MKVFLGTAGLPMVSEGKTVDGIRVRFCMGNWT